MGLTKGYQDEKYIYMGRHGDDERHDGMAGGGAGAG
jgi:hypothetical protein